MRRLLVLLLLLFSTPNIFAYEKHPAAIASAKPLATEAGLQILQQGGNAFDAAITVSAVLAVVEPQSSGIGGGGFWLLHRQNDGKQIMIDGREMAPGKSHRDMYLDQNGDVVPGLSLNGALAAGIPGEIAALVHIAEKYGNLSLSKTLAPAIKAAEEGFLVTERLQGMIKFRLEVLRSFPESAKIFLENNEVPSLGYKIIQKDLGATLRAVAEKGVAGFYQGDVANKLISGVQAANGIWTFEDLKNYKVVERKPVTGTYHGIKITSASPPSSGGIVIKQALNILERTPLSSLSGITKKHVVIEAMRRAYQDRAIYLGDPDFVDIPKHITTKSYAGIKAGSIKNDQATPSEELKRERSEGEDTTHFSILDSEGNRVSATLSINYPFGSGFIVPGTGVLLNDEMDDFSIRPGTPNAYGLIGDKANEIVPYKRPLSSMSPTFLESENKIAVVGTPGGSRIISMVLLAILDFAEENSPESWVSLPRYHHQYMPDSILFEPDTFSDQEKKELEKMGHKLKPRTRSYGNMQAILLDRKTGEIKAASDPRGEGSAQFTEINPTKSEQR
ncbi:MAG: gamma-glutamyltransferase [Gammaproteobacteria bacterium]